MRNKCRVKPSGRPNTSDVLKVTHIPPTGGDHGVAALT
jgi:hypothetical protein